MIIIQIIMHNYVFNIQFVTVPHCTQDYTYSSCVMVEICLQKKQEE